MGWHLKICLVLAVCCGLTGCIPIPERCDYGDCAGGVSEDQLTQFVPGETRRADVLMALGVPTLRKCDDQVFMYLWSRKAASMLLLPLPIPFGGGAGVISSNGRKLTYKDGLDLDSKVKRLVAIEFSGDRFKRYVFVPLPLDSKEDFPIRVPDCGELDEFIDAWFKYKL
jgi:outer membrane protein assembly factor BamE (lipoprotein component of BamABCDE complex)